MPFPPVPKMASTIAANARQTKKAAAIHHDVAIGLDPSHRSAEPCSSGARADMFVLLTGLLLRVEETL